MYTCWSRTTVNGWGLETTDWENYYSLSRSSPSSSTPSPRVGRRARSPGVMLIALLPPAGNMYSRNALNIRTKTTCKRHIFAQSLLLSRPWKVTLPGRSKWTKLARDGYACHKFRWIVDLYSNFFRNYASRLIWRFANIVMHDASHEREIAR